VSALSINADAADENSSQLSPHSGAPGFNVDALLEEHARLAEMAGRARLLEDQLAQLSARHEELREGMLSLAGRNGWLESKLEERESELKLLTDEQPRTSWWKRLFGS
jgi:chromosome segregation ATPase